MNIDFETEMKLFEYNRKVIDSITDLSPVKYDVTDVEEHAAKLATADPEFMKRLEDELK